MPNGLNQYDRVGGATLLYDANGNLTSDPGAGTGGTTYVYDVENRLVQAVSGGVTATLTYDPLGRLYQLVKGAANTRFLYDGDAMVTEYNSAGTVLNRYAHGSSAAADDPLVWFSGSGLTTKRYLHSDHLGSIVAATNGNGAPTINSYDEYGVPSSANVGRFQYTGQVWLSELGTAPCGLYYYKARMYSACLGRFLQTDPVGYEGGLNLYAYVADDPVNDGDPTGLACGTRNAIDAAGCFDSGIDVEGGSKNTKKEQSSSTTQSRNRSNENTDDESHIGLNGFMQEGPAPQMMITGDTGAMMQDAIEQNMVMQHQMSQQEWRERQEARGNGAITGASILEGGLAARAAIRVVASGGVRAGLRNFGEKLFAGHRQGILNNNRYLRLGWGPGANATRRNFYEQFRLVIGNKDSWIHFHIDLPWTR